MKIKTTSFALFLSILIISKINAFFDNLSHQYDELSYEMHFFGDN